jgi:cell division protein FtsI (penicillin-binding protein 3)
MTVSGHESVSYKRRALILLTYLAVMAMLMWRAVDLQVLNRDFLQGHGDARALRTVEIPAHRGMITDRNGEPLAISTPVSSIWATPRKVMASGVELAPLAKCLEIPVDELKSELRDRAGRDFVYLKRQIEPSFAEKVMNLGIPGVSLEQEFRRYYPAGEISAHVVGFTNIDDVGQEGLELAYDEWLRGKPGSKQVLQDRLGRVVADVESIRTAEPGKNLELSIDQRIQYLAYRELKAAVTAHKARSGSMVVLDAGTGEVLAMVGQPSYNPNNRSGLKGEYFRNRAVTDVFEPGSTIKAFIISAALDSGLYTADTMIDTRPGFFKVGSHTIRDHSNFGVIDVATVIKKSSNVGASKIALSLEPSKLWNTLSSVGLGATTGSGFPGEASGYLASSNSWSEVEIATIAFGYGVSVTALQLAQAYTVIANNGMLLPVSFVKVKEPVTGRRVMSAGIAGQLRKMLAAVVNKEGTGQRAAVEGYTVAGKTGTVHKAEPGGYSADRYISLFAGMAPLHNPRLVMVVVIDEPQGEEYYGGLVAAPVFAKVMAGALRLLDIAPDDLPALNNNVIAGGVHPVGDFEE